CPHFTRDIRYPGTISSLMESPSPPVPITGRGLNNDYYMMSYLSHFKFTSAPALI
ncbi:hypothetical protein CEXT_249511, partial [Caerostris extrusa]